MKSAFDGLVTTYIHQIRAHNSNERPIVYPWKQHLRWQWTKKPLAYREFTCTAKQIAPGSTKTARGIVQELYDFSRNKLQQKVSQQFLVNRGVLYDILKV